MALFTLPLFAHIRLSHARDDMATGAALLKQLRQRKSTAEEPHLRAYYAASRAPKVTPAPADEWISDNNGRRQRVRAAVPGIDDTAPCRHGIKASSCSACSENIHGVNGHGAKAGSAFEAPGSASGVSLSIDSEAVMKTATLQSKLVGPVNAVADAFTTVSLQEPAAAGADEDAAGWELVRQHNSEFACWIVIGGCVLDVTSYLGHHPGGSSVIEKLAGRDATKAYERARHSRGADMKLADFTIGKLSDIKRLRRAACEARECRERLEAAAKYLN